jgi:uncharacterized membrane protein YfbV (UPF0208 family)
MLYEQLSDKPFSYGETLSLIQQYKGKAVSSLPMEDFVFPDNSIIRVTNNGIKLMEFLQE